MRTFSAFLALCEGNSPVTGEFPSQRPVTRSFDVFIDLRLNKRLSKLPKRWWCETPLRPLWHHCNDSRVTPYWQILLIVFLFRTCVILCFMLTLSPYTCFMWNLDSSEKSKIWWCIIHFSPLQWRHNGRYSVSNHQPHDYLLNRLFRRRSKKTSKLRATGLCAVNSPGTGEFPAQMASNAENSIWWRHHGNADYPTVNMSFVLLVIFSTKEVGPDFTKASLKFSSGFA